MGDDAGADAAPASKLAGCTCYCSGECCIGMLCPALHAQHMRTRCEQDENEEWDAVWPMALAANVLMYLLPPIGMLIAIFFRLSQRRLIAKAKEDPYPEGFDCMECMAAWCCAICFVGKDYQFTDKPVEEAAEGA